MFFHTNVKTATFTNPENCGAGFVRDESGTLLNATPFIGMTGQVLEGDDTAYDAECPNGSEPILYLVNFDGSKIWVESGALTLRY